MRRSELPAEIQDTSNWPRVDTSGFSQTMLDQYLAKERAVIDWLNGKSLRSVEARTGINRGTVQRAIERCLAPHTDGTIQGFRGLIAHARTRPYRRTAESSRPISNQSPGIGLSGALGQLFERLPTLESIVDRAISKGAVGISEHRRIFGLRDLQLQLINACRLAGITASEYPLNNDEKAYRSLGSWIRRRIESRIFSRPSSNPSQSWLNTFRPFSTVELDGHKLDIRLRVRYPDANGVPINLETERLYVITLIDVCTRIVIGWHLVPASEYDHHDVLAAIQDALRPKVRTEDLTFPGLHYKQGAGFVVDVAPELSYACWDVLKVDNAASHLSVQTFEPICRFIACRLEAGPVAEPKVRPFIERFFGTLTNSVIQKLPGTTGSTPKSSAAKRGRATPLAHLITMAELEALLHVTIANYHATPHDGLNGRTPLEALQATLPSTAPSIRKLPPHMQARLHQLQLVHISTVHGSAARAIAPYISLFGARYSSDVLARTAGLIGESIRVFIRPDDMREAWAYLPNGAELGRLTVLDGWRYSRHTLKLRKYILKERRLRKLQFTTDQDPVQQLADAQRKNQRRTRRQGTLMLQLEQVGATQPDAHKDSPNRTQRSVLPPLFPTDMSELRIQHF